MDDRIGGSFPGGPHRVAPGHGKESRPLPDTVRELEERITRRRLARARLRRVRRIRLCFLCATLLAAVMGYAVGFATRTRRADLLRATDEGWQLDTQLSKQVNRTLLELWKMEDFESVRDLGRTR